MAWLQETQVYRWAEATPLAIRRIPGRDHRVRFTGAQDYALISPLGSGRVWSSFVASAGGETLVELRVFNTDCVTDAERQVELRRLQLISIVDHPGIRRIIDFVSERKPPFVILESLNLPASVSDAGRDVASPVWGIENCGRLFDALACVHRYGVVAGPLGVADIRMRASDDWLLDLTTERTQPDHADIPPPELSLGDGGNIADPAADVYSLSAILSTFVKSQPNSGVGDAASLIELLTRGMDPDSDARPTAAQMTRELSVQAAANRRKRDLREQQDSQLSGTVIPDFSAQDLQNLTLAEPSSLAMSVPMPDQLGRFTLHERIGAGAAGTVYRATDCSNNEIVALKILNTTQAQDSSMLRRFTREARLLAQVGSPFVARLLDANSDQGLHFLAIEFISGGTLSTAMDNAGRIDELKSLRLILDAVNALTVAHQQSIIHRDIKPENILLTTAGKDFVDAALQANATSVPAGVNDTIPLVKLSDFGLARADYSSESMAVTQDGTILGTPLYMSPEQCRGTAADARSDIYSVGATLFHMLAGRPPFQGDSAVALMNSHCHEPIPSLRQMCPEISDGCIAVVEKCLAKNPDARYVNATALLADLERLLHGEPTSMVLHPATPATNGLNVL
ncbi:MAG: serine/threonine-protein kinase, partial [Planctomycetota bacterium]|nr:serine/threonine-protein kinase [Planctomycetota bacterium]